MTFVSSQDPVLTEALKTLGPESYTAHRLQHASSEHLYLTTRRCFIGPIPEGWLKSHRKEWYKHYLRIHSKERAPSFNAGVNQGRQRRLSGIDGPSTSAAFRNSFPQPGDIRGNDGGNDDDPEQVEGEDEEDDEDGQDTEIATLVPVTTFEEGSPDREATLNSPPALNIPRSDPVDMGRPLESASLGPSGYSTEDALNSFSTAVTAISPETSSAGNEPDQPNQTTSSLSPANQATSASSTSFETASEGSSIAAKEPDPPNIPSYNPDLSDEQDENDSDGGDLTPRPTRNGKDQAFLNPFDDRAYQNPSAPGTAAESMTSQSPLIQAKPSDGDQVPNPVQDHASAEILEQAPLRSPGFVRFAEPDVQPIKRELQVRARLAQSAQRRLPSRFTRGKLQDGEVVKVEKMLVRFEITSGSEQPDEDYDEKYSMRVETRTVEKWREFMVVCRESHDENSVLCLELYKTRVIPASNKTKTKKRFKYELHLDPHKVGVNLYSSLDKTLVIWHPKGSRSSICFLRPRSSASAVEWYTFLRGVLGHDRPRTLQVNIPDLRVSLRIENPFARFESAQHMADAAEGDEAAMLRTMKEEQALAGKIVEKCMTMLDQTGEWKDILPKWAENDRVGLAWRRYDRLEWVHGANERKMYGTLAMQRTHELELRPKQHYPTSIRPVGAGGDQMLEPAPVEGFLIRLTSQKGNEQKLGKLFYKRLYFTTHNHYLLFQRPAKAAPPPPPKMPMQDASTIPTVKQIADKTPLIYAVNPYPLHGEKVAWLDPSVESPENMRIHDQDAFDEAERNIHSLLNCDGFINLCDVMKVRKMKPGATPADDNIESGSDVDFDHYVNDSQLDDGSTTEVDSDRTFELVMRNGLVLRLQAYNKATRKQWVKRLRAIVTYWSIRKSNDMDLLRSVRRQNLAQLDIDERAEAEVGQFAQKWEVTKSFASPELYHMCGISCCRTINRSGVLFRKPRMHKTFTRCHVVLCDGHLVIFEDTMRKITGKQVEHIHHERIASIDLRGCYLYSGLITENDLLYQNRTFDSNMPGNHALPRLYAEDNWTSTDEDGMTSFVIWCSQHKGWFKSSSDDMDDVKESRKRERREDRRADKGKEANGGARQRIKRVSQLGVTGRSVVFKARSRAERDHWVIGISDEIERIGQGEEVRVVDEG